MSGERRPSLPPLVILVGLTGVGKSTAVKALEDGRPGTVVLPNRRTLADRIVIPEALRLAGDAPRPVPDRLERFRLTARYRERYPGGLAHALQRYLEDEAPPPAPLLLFDNLRGESEVGFAVEAFPGARFVVLEAPADVRVLRLAGRGDAFDRVASRAGTGAEPADGAAADRPDAGPADPTGGMGRAPAGDALLELLRRVPDLARLTDLPALAASAATLEPDAVLTGARVVAEESAHYDPSATWACLQPLPPERRIRLDTGRQAPARVAERIRAWL